MAELVAISARLLHGAGIIWTWTFALLRTPSTDYILRMGHSFADTLNLLVTPRYE